MRVSSNLLFYLIVLFVFNPTSAQWGWPKAKETTTVPPTTTTTTTTTTATTTTAADDRGTSQDNNSEPLTVLQPTTDDGIVRQLNSADQPSSETVNGTTNGTTTNGTESGNRESRGFLEGSRVNGGWSNWGPGGPCSSQCGLGWRHMVRTCTNPTPANDGANCIGASHYIEACMITCYMYGSPPPYMPTPPPGFPQQAMQPAHMVYGEPVSTSYVQPPGYQPPTPVHASSESTIYDVNQHLPPMNLVPFPVPTYATPPPRVYVSPRSSPRPNYAPLQIAPGAPLTRPATPAVREPQVNPSYWTDWTQWSTCSRPCDLGESMRRRECRWNQGTDYCFGSNWQSKHCYMRSCSSARKDPTPVQAQPAAARPWSGAPSSPWSPPVVLGPPARYG